ncbi:MAG TPA: phosphotransferase [Sphingobium sp.]
MLDASREFIDGNPLPRPEEITPRWLNQLFAASTEIGEISEIAASCVGAGQLGETIRLTPRYVAGQSGPPTLIGKFASADVASRNLAQRWSLYEREVRFYHELAGRAAIRVPHCHAARMDEGGSFVLMLEDLAPASPGDQFSGLSAKHMEQAVRGAAALHAAFWDADRHPDLSWLDAGFISQPFYTADIFRSVWPYYRDRYRAQLEPDHVRVCDALSDRYEAYARPLSSPRCVTHNDYRPDNMLLTPNDLTVVDWQSVALGWNAVDLSYLIGGAFEPADRGAAEPVLMGCYHDELVRRGVGDYSAAQLAEDYRRFTFAGINVAVGAAMMVKRTERGDRLFLTMLNRHVRNVLDHDALNILD